MLKELLVLTLQNDFKSELKKFRKKWRIPPKGFSSSEKRVSFEENLGLKDSFSYEKDIQKILDNPQLKLSVNQKKYLRNYLLCNDLTPDFYSKIKLPYESIGISEVPLKGSVGIEKITLEIYRDTTLDDVRNVWEKIEKAKRKIPGFREGRRSYPRNFLRDFRMYELHQRGVSIRSIKEIIHEEFGKIVMPPEISNIIYKFEKKYIGK